MRVSAPLRVTWDWSWAPVIRAQEGTDTDRSLAELIGAEALLERESVLLEGRLAPSVDDVLALAEPVLKHRMALNFSARADGVTIEDVIRRLTAPMA